MAIRHLLALGLPDFHDRILEDAGVTPAILGQKVEHWISEAAP